VGRAPLAEKWVDQGAFIALTRERKYRDILTVLPNRFNKVAEHIEAYHPIVRAFHGDGKRLE
jgi:hypothetical protein